MFCPIVVSSFEIHQAGVSPGAVKSGVWHFNLIRRGKMKSRGRVKGRKRRGDQTERYLDQLRRKLGVRPLTETKLKEVKKALSLARGDKVLAAALLGIGKTTIYRALQD